MCYTSVTRLHMARKCNLIIIIKCIVANDYKKEGI